MFTYKASYPEISLSEIKWNSIDSKTQNFNISGLKKKFITDGILQIKLKDLMESDMYHQFDEITRLLGSHVQSNAGRRNISVISNKKMISVDLERDYVKPHAETSFSPARPSVIAFLCADIENLASLEGKTTLIDGTKLWNSLDLNTRQILLNTKICYNLRIQIPRKNDVPNEYRSWFIDSPGVEDVFINQSQGTLKFKYTTDYLNVHPLTKKISIANHSFIDLDSEPQISSRNILYASSSHTFLEVQSALEIVFKKVHSFTYSFTWDKGHILVLDNYRFMHGRLPYNLNLKREIFIKQFKHFLYY